MPSPSIRKVAVTTPLFLDPEPREIEAPIADPGEERNVMMTFEFAKFVNTHTTEYIRLADTKAAILVTLLSANLLVLVQKAGQYIGEGHVAWRLGLVLLAVAYALVSLGVAVNIVRPRLFRNAKHGHLFWEDITAQDKGAYAASFQRMLPNDLCYELGEHNHNLASSAIRKYRWLRISFVMALVSICFSATIIILTSL